MVTHSKKDDENKHHIIEDYMSELSKLEKRCLNKTL